MAESMDQSEAQAKPSRQSNTEDCPICHEPMDLTSPRDTWTLACNHTFHARCIRTAVHFAAGRSIYGVLNGATCPYCRGNIFNHENDRIGDSLASMSLSTDFLRYAHYLEDPARMNRGTSTKEEHLTWWTNSRRERTHERNDSDRTIDRVAAALPPLVTPIFQHSPSLRTTGAGMANTSRPNSSRHTYRQRSRLGFGFVPQHIHSTSSARGRFVPSQAMRSETVLPEREQSVAPDPPIQVRQSRLTSTLARGTAISTSHPHQAENQHLRTSREVANRLEIQNNLQAQILAALSTQQVVSTAYYPEPQFLNDPRYRRNSLLNYSGDLRPSTNARPSPAPAFPSVFGLPASNLDNDIADDDETSRGG